MHARGFTLIELMTVMTISAVLVAMAVPSFAGSTLGTRAANASNSLLASFELARSEAIRRNVRVSVCREQNLTDLANPACSGGAVNGIAGNDWGSWLGCLCENQRRCVSSTFETGGADGDDTVLRVEQF